MGTRSLIYFENVINEKVCVVVVIYQQYNGHPDGVGSTLVKFIKNIKLVNGFSYPPPKGIANGFDCLIAQFIAQEKKEVGGFYIATPGYVPSVDWIYHVRYQNNKIKIIIEHNNKIDHWMTI